jgi:thioredoxin
MSKPLELNADTFGKEVLEEAAPVLVDFWSQTCPHCLRLGPDFDKAAELQSGQVKFVKVSVQDARALFGQYGVHAVPTLVFFREGEEVARRQGATTSEEIVSWLDEHV